MVSQENRHNKYCAEIFGFPPTNNSRSARDHRTRYTCPFLPGNPPCDLDNKISNLTDENGDRLLEHQSGACTVWHNPNWSDMPYPVVICPYRFLENNIVFNSIKERFFDNNEIVVTGEIGISPFGRADGLIGEIINGGNNEDINRIAHIEYQSDATTGTRGVVECVRDFYQGIDVTERDYGYGLNSKNSIKTSSLQMIDKGFLFEELHIPSIWVMQDYLFKYLRRIYNFEINDVTQGELPEDKFIFFLVTKLNYNGHQDKFELSVENYYATSPEAIQKSISGKEHSITVDNLRDKIRNYMRDRTVYRI